MSSLYIKNKLAVILAVISGKWLIIAILFVISFIIAVMAYPDSHTISDDFLVWIKTLIIPLLFITYQIIDALVFTRKNYVEENDNGVSLHTGNLLTNNQTNLLYSQLNGVRVAQSFSHKIFGISQIIFDQSSGISTHLWGFNYKEAQDFANNISKNFSIKVKNN